MSTWQTLKNAALIKNYAIAQIEISNNTGIFVKYHHTSYQVFKMKKELDKIQKSLEA